MWINLLGRENSLSGGSQALRGECGSDQGGGLILGLDGSSWERLDDLAGEGDLKTGGSA